MTDRKEPAKLFPPMKRKPQTNYDRLISKTPEELAEWLDNNTSNFPIYFDWLDWLKSPVEVDE